MLKISSLSKKFDKRKALNGLELEIKRGEVFGLLGPNGAGKSTTIKILSGIMEQDSGEIYIDGQLYTRDNTDIKRHIAYVPDQPFVYTRLTGEEHFHFYCDLYKIPFKERLEKIDFFFKLFEFEQYRHELVETYSAGTRQKLLVAQAFATEPSLLLLDEPLVSIDPLVARKFKSYLKEFCKGGRSVLFATHILSLAADVSSEIGIIVNGEIVVRGSLDELTDNSDEKSLEEFYYKTVIKHEGLIKS